MDVLYLYFNDILEYNLLYMQSDFTCNPGLTFTMMVQSHRTNTVVRSGLGQGGVYVAQSAEFASSHCHFYITFMNHKKCRKDENEVKESGSDLPI